MAYTNVNNSKLYFDSTKYIGNAGTNNVTGLQFQPDWVYLASDSNGNNHHMYDAVRGVQQRLVPNEPYNQSTQTNAVSSFNSDGFTLGNNGDINTNSASFISWNWKANGAGVSNTEGDITATVSANTTSGFSIIKFTGNSSTSQSFGHGLNGTPKAWIIKNLTDGSTDFTVYYNNELRLKLNTIEVAESNYLMTANATTITTPSSSGGAWGNANGKDFVVYAFQEITGFSSIGLYTGNGEPSSNCPFIYTGFRPSYILGTSSSYASQHWFINDDKRLGYNGSSAWFKADSGGAQLTNLVNPDFVANGFKLQNNNDIYNKNGQTYFYMCFASAPLVGSNNVPCTAR